MVLPENFIRAISVVMIMLRRVVPNKLIDDRRLAIGMGLDPSNNISRAHCASLAGHFPAVLEECMRRYTPNTELCGNSLFVFRVEFDQPELRFQLSGRLLKRRCHYLAGRAPGRPEIDDHRYVIPGDMLLETGAGQFRRVCSK